MVQAQKGILSGTIKDSLAQSPISFASIAVFNMHGHVVDGTVTDSLGGFHFFNLKKGQYAIVVKFIGYHQKKIVVDFDGRSQTNITEIALVSTDQRLTEVKITGELAAQKHSADRQRYQASQYRNAVGGTALDIVKNLPSAAVDGNGNISMRGNTGIIVLINGKPSYLDPVTILSQIAANDVTDVEYITSPSAQFDPDGKGGIINIMTKKAASDGFAWIFNLQGGLPSIDDYGNKRVQKRFGGDISFQFKKNKLEWSGSANYMRNDNAGFREGDVYTIIGDRQTFFPSRGERSFDKYNFGIRLNGAYALSQNSNLI